jgi:RNA polymerase sigma-B factor
MVREQVMPFLRVEEGTNLAPSGRVRAVASERADDDLVMRWLMEFVSLRERINLHGSTSSATSELKSRLSHHFTPLVESVARRFVASGEPFEDLVQEGFLGLLSALEHYDPGKGVKFSTYATHFVAGAIRHCLRDRGKIIKEPAWLNELYGKIARTTDSLTQQLGRPPQAFEIAQTLNLTEESVEEILATRQVFHVAAFSTGGEDDDDSMVGLVDPEKIKSGHYVTLQLPIEDRIVLEEAATKLKALEQHVLHEFFYKDLNQTEIARKFGISCNYVSHILKNSTKKLRKIMGEADVRDRARHRESSVVDPISGLFTETHVLARINEELTRSARANQSASLILVHIGGMPEHGVRREEIWGFCGEAIQKAIRRVDLAGRFEKDSLLFLLPHSCSPGVVAMQLADVIIAAGAAHHVQLTVKVGTAVYPTEGRFFRDLVATAAAAAEAPLINRNDKSDLRLAA